MSWKNFIDKESTNIVAPWTGGHELFMAGGRRYRIKLPVPVEHGWYAWDAYGLDCRVIMEARPDIEALRDIAYGYLIGDRFVPETSNFWVDDTIKYAIGGAWAVALAPPLDRFTRVSIGFWASGKRIFRQEEMPSGPEQRVLEAFQMRAADLRHIPGVVPALETAFRFESEMRDRVEKRRLALHLKRLEEEKRAEVARTLGSAVGRRELAKTDFEAAAKAALAVGGAEYLESRRGYGPHEMVVTYRWNRRRFGCVCDRETLRIVDAGVCLSDHTTGEEGDTRFTLESLPGVVAEAHRKGKLVVQMHHDDWTQEDD